MSSKRPVKKIELAFEKLRLPSSIAETIISLISNPLLYYEDETQSAIQVIEDKQKHGSAAERRAAGTILDSLFPRNRNVMFINLRPDILVYIVGKYLGVLDKHLRKSYKGRNWEKKEDIKKAFDEIFNPRHITKQDHHCPRNIDDRSRTTIAVSFLCYRYGLNLVDTLNHYYKLDKLRKSDNPEDVKKYKNIIKKAKKLSLKIYVTKEDLSVIKILAMM